MAKHSILYSLLITTLLSQDLAATSIYFYSIVNKSDHTIYLPYQQKIKLEPNEPYKLEVYTQKLQYLTIENQDEFITLDTKYPLEDGCHIEVYDDENGILTIDFFLPEEESE